ncbi:CCR4-NOT transcription complex subunit 4-like isoform X2 [Haliotis cracherodii]|uniref:CCR4-NOT transcription complex subunit 4-like isoform X2 n=1 Tax=Haliotis cracherodii TaxID=6455 RepID=UPI0039ECC3F0
MAGEEQVECPLCMELLEIDDVNFFPCTCGYQICRFCWHRIRTDENGLCPACRKQYPEDPAEFKPLTEDELSRIKKERRQKDLQRKQKAAENRKHLANVSVLSVSRVVQKNLVFVVGLSQRLAEADVLKKHEYFGKFGKIHKVVINQSTTYAGAQVHGPSASAYVTYTRSDDALRAILAVNNVHIDGRTLKASLGTTKYCSHFLRGSQCQKSDCMYLHELGEEAASFTKEEMQMGKHQEYEQKLLEQFLNSQNTANNHTTNNKKSRKKSSSPVADQVNIPQPNPPEPAVETPPKSQPSPSTVQPPPTNTSKEAWPSLQGQDKGERIPNGNRPTHSTVNHSNRSNTPPNHSKAVGNGRKRNTNTDNETQINSHSPDRPQELTDTPIDRESAPPTISQNNASTVPRPRQTLPSQSPSSQPSFPMPNTQSTPPPQSQPVAPIGSNRKPIMFENSANSLSYYSAGGSGSAYPCNKLVKPSPQVIPQNATDVPASVTPPAQSADPLPVSSSSEWQSSSSSNYTSYSNSKDIQDDDLGFDPCDESFKGLADLIEKENGLHGTTATTTHHYTNMQQHHHSGSSRSVGLQGGVMPPVHPPQPRSLPPGFSLSHIQQQQQQLQQQQHFQHRQQMPFFRQDMTNHKMMDFLPGYSQQSFSHMQQQQQQHQQQQHQQQQQHPQQQQQNSPFHNSLPDRPLPGRSAISAEHTHMQPQQQHADVFKMEDMQNQLRSLLPNINISFGALPQTSNTTQQRTQPTPNSHKSWPNSCTPPESDSPWLTYDPAILSSGNIQDGNTESAPHWLKSIHQLTEVDTPSPNHRLPFVQQFPSFSAASMWPPQTHNPPPGFQAPIRNNTVQHPEPHKISEGL